MHHELGQILTDAAGQIVAWCRRDVPSGRTPGRGGPVEVAPLAVLVRVCAASFGVSEGGAQATIKAAFGITMLGIDVDLLAVDPTASSEVRGGCGGAALRRALRRNADHDLATVLFLRKINIAIAIPVAVAAAGGGSTLAVGMLIDRIADAATHGPSFDPFDEAHLAVFVRDLVANGMVLHPGDTAASLAAAMAVALERLAGATSTEAVAAAWMDALGELGLAA